MVCEANGGCSFPDASCESGRRFAEYTPSGNACVPLDPTTSSTSGDSTSTSSDPTADSIQPSTASSSTSTGNAGDSSSTTNDIIPGTTSSTTGGESSTGRAPTFEFFDDFERADSPDVGNGWVEKTPDAFALIDGGIRRVGSELSYQNNLVYRPGGAWLDAEVIVELVWLDISTDYGSPQCSGLNPTTSTSSAP